MASLGHNVVFLTERTKTVDERSPIYKISTLIPRPVAIGQFTMAKKLREAY